MQIIIALVFGAGVGGLLHFLQGGRSLRGVALAPVVGAFSGAFVWMVLTWSGVTTMSPWLWLVSFAAPLVVVPLLLVVLTRVRTGRDARERVRLGIA